MIIAVDFDGTIVEHRFPDIGSPVPGAFAWMKRFQELGAKLILWTMRSDGREQRHGGEPGDFLANAVEFCRKNGVEFLSHNSNPSQVSWTDSPKCYAHAYIDDAAVGCPMRVMGSGRSVVDWDKVGPIVEELINDHFRRKPLAKPLEMDTGAIPT